MVHGVAGDAGFSGAFDPHAAAAFYTKPGQQIPDRQHIRLRGAWLADTVYAGGRIFQIPAFAADDGAGNRWHCRGVSDAGRGGKKDILQALFWHLLIFQIFDLLDSIGGMSQNRIIIEHNKSYAVRKARPIPR